MSLFKWTTTEVFYVRQLMQCLKDVVIQTNFCFSNKGIDIVSLNPNNTIFCKLHLKTEELKKNGDYECPLQGNLLVGVNLMHLVKAMRGLLCSNSSNSYLVLYMDENERNSLKMKLCNVDRNVICKYSFNIIEVDEEQFQIPTIDFDHVLQLESKYFQNQIKELSYIQSEKIDIQCVNHQLILKSQGTFVNYETITEEKDECKKSAIKFLKSKPSTLYQGCFSMKDLHTMIKFCNLSTEVLFSLKNDTPLIIQFQIIWGNITVIINHS